MAAANESRALVRDTIAPPAYLPLDAWMDHCHAVAGDCFAALADFEPLTFVSADDVELSLAFVLPGFASGEWRDGVDVWRDPDVRYDARPDLLMHLRRAVELLEKDIAERSL